MADGSVRAGRQLDELAWLDATEQAELVRRGEVSPVELVEAAIDAPIPGRRASVAARAAAAQGLMRAVRHDSVA